MNANSVEVGAAIRRYRHQRGYTLEDLAARADMDFGTISRIELGKISPNVDTLFKLGAALGVEPYQFLEPAKSKPKSKNKKK